ncbi:uncharacterized peptidase C1-like protein F26E4.3 [Bicyclus anynana]|uniref:Uncharacterized peptidase C1-like protein F26E4.3 n=1 Tax=Bicyclus anynana TaxID=110368 RepID=A0A6J1MW29_BICAN|nr:uncharacterized peptidase C1-like protein F26E4.3 [Bicyclus anynana]
MTNIVQPVLFCGLLVVVAAYDRPGLPPGPYCGLGDRCCKGRQDHCSAKIKDTICYCDEFCDRDSQRDDCCPDYNQVCRGELPPPPIIACTEGNRNYQEGEKIKRDCNECVCTQDPYTKKPYFKCETDPCIMSEQVYRGVNSGRSTWRATNYTQFYGKKLKDGLIYKLGTFKFSNEVEAISVPSKGDRIYPTHFDATEAWPGFISPVVDQEWCGSDWAITVATVASDRFAIQSNGAEKVVLSPQVQLSCNQEQKGCAGGYIDIAWNFARLFGLVDKECLPYKANVTKCKYNYRGDLLSDGCRPVVSGRTSRYRVGPLYRIKNVPTDIMYEIMNSGPVHAIMTVYQDFFHYRDGIYRRSRYGNEHMSGLHSVRIIGWGEDRGDKYWKVANSWGCDWGENGYFRIERGHDQVGIESFVVATWSEVTEAYRRT